MSVACQGRPEARGVDASRGGRPARRLPRRALLALGLAVTFAGGCSMPDRVPAVHETSAATPRASVTSAVPKTYLAECLEDELTQRPVSYTIACADGNASLDELTWSGWGRPRATAEGVVVQNTCEPDCASGKLRRDPVTVVASDLKARGTAHLYTRLTVTYTGQVPPGALPVETLKLPF